MEIKIDQLQQVLPKCPDIILWHVLLNTHLPLAGIISPDEVSRFIAQTAHESADYSILTENLNYSERGLLSTFSKYFNPTTVAKYARKPEMIANRVYANRMGNGDESSGDGWKFRGRGIIQITGKNNYEACSLAIFGNDRLIRTPEDLIDPTYALKSALWYWSVNRLNSITDISALTKRINGGTIGLTQRIAHYDHTISILQET